MGVLGRLFGGRFVKVESAVFVGCDDERVWVKNQSRETVSIPWVELDGVAIRTNDSGPLGVDVVWLLGHADTIVPFPNSATGVEKVLATMQAQLPTFDSGKVIEAMVCANNKTFVLWDRQGRHRV